METIGGMPWSQHPPQSASLNAAANAKALRRVLTEAERRLWWHLRHRLPLEGSHFRRQVALGPYVTDFCCLALKIIVEVDGNQHGQDRQAAYDLKRTRLLEAQGFRILRFSNADVMRGMESVLDTIHAACAQSSLSADQPGRTTPTPNPSPQGGGE